ncbi:MAG: hypothetical protein PF570_01940 [Candidatus Cloacimonetes bacterium]|jgi:hypothetical protein|nr:hypothetical protein [Candidatus Cloacimonadota bacterium]
MKKIVIFSLVIFIFCTSLWGEFEIDLESGAIFTGYNDVRIPGNQGTLFSLKDDLETDIETFFRARLNYHFNPKHHISLLYAPLIVEANGNVDENLEYQGEIFPANTDLACTFKFNSYRLSYRYDFIRKADLTFGMGFTAKIRDALISLESDNIKAKKENIGFVPIINFRLVWDIIVPLSVIFEGDALAAPQGRAEDVALGLKYQINQNLGLRLGYRILEGGADNDEVYTFSLFHYAVLGLNFRF